VLIPFILNIYLSKNKLIKVTIKYPLGVLAKWINLSSKVNLLMPATAKTLAIKDFRVYAFV
jgi:hypothetical protein